MQAAIDKLQENSSRTTIVIAHRLSTIRNADKVRKEEGETAVCVWCEWCMCGWYIALYMMLTLSLSLSPLSLSLSLSLSFCLSFAVSLVQQSKIIVLNPTLDDKGSVVAEEGTLSV